jgi:hypothetical protein
MLKQIAFVLLLTAAGAASADSTLAISDAWIRHIPGNRPMAGYFVLQNNGDKVRNLVGVASPAFGEVQLHRTITVNGVASMSAVDSVSVPAHGRVTFRPGGYHLMMKYPPHELKVGDTPQVSLQFGDGYILKTTFTIKPPWQE